MLFLFANCIILCSQAVSSFSILGFDRCPSFFQIIVFFLLLYIFLFLFLIGCSKRKYRKGRKRGYGETLEALLWRNGSPTEDNSVRAKGSRYVPGFPTSSMKGHGAPLPRKRAEHHHHHQKTFFFFKLFSTFFLSLLLSLPRTRSLFFFFSLKTRQH